MSSASKPREAPAAVRFSSAVQEIEPQAPAAAPAAVPVPVPVPASASASASNPAPTASSKPASVNESLTATTNTSDRFDTFNEVAADQIKAFQKSLQGLPLQERRMSTFGFEAFSLPASRVRAPIPPPSRFSSTAACVCLCLPTCFPIPCHSSLLSPPFHKQTSIQRHVFFLSFSPPVFHYPLAPQRCLRHWPASTMPVDDVSSHKRSECFHPRIIAPRLRPPEAQLDARHHALHILSFAVPTLFRFSC